MGGFFLSRDRVANSQTQRFEGIGDEDWTPYLLPVRAQENLWSGMVAGSRFQNYTGRWFVMRLTGELDVWQRSEFILQIAS